MKKKEYKIIALGDTHGRNQWKKIIEANKDADKIVFCGDYFDSFDVPFAEQNTNFAEILILKRTMPDKVVVLLGNHEYHYLSAYSNDRYSGHQLHYAKKIEEVLEQAIKEDLIQIAYEHDNFIFTHAGITKEWCETNKITDTSIKNVAEQINNKFKTEPNIFKFTPSTGFDNVGDSITQPPIWVRPRALKSNNIEGYRQVVGHTHQPKGIAITKDLIFIDTLEYGNEYLIINNGLAKVGIVK